MQSNAHTAVVRQTELLVVPESLNWIAYRAYSRPLRHKRLANISDCVLVLAYFLAYRWAKKRTNFKKFSSRVYDDKKRPFVYQNVQLVYNNKHKSTACKLVVFNESVRPMSVPVARFLHVAYVCVWFPERPLNVLIESVQLQLYIAKRWHATNSLLPTVTFRYTVTVPLNRWTRHPALDAIWLYDRPNVLRTRGQFFDCSTDIYWTF